VVVVVVAVSSQRFFAHYISVPARTHDAAELKYDSIRLPETEAIARDWS
jgi:hypothetical protein